MSPNGVPAGIASNLRRSRGTLPAIMMAANGSKLSIASLALSIIPSHPPVDLFIAWVGSFYRYYLKAWLLLLSLPSLLYQPLLTASLFVP